MLKARIKQWLAVSGEFSQAVSVKQPLLRMRSARLSVIHAAVTRENAAKLVSGAMEGAPELDLLSVDIDGDDLHVLQRITAGLRPRVIVSEYNGKFPPPHPNHRWAGDDYHGASIQARVGPPSSLKFLRDALRR